jgi:hypothetical protein
MQLEVLMRVAGRLTVELIAQEADFIQLDGRGPEQALRKGFSSGYDFMPVKTGGRLIGICHLRELTEASRSPADIRAVTKPVDVDRLVALDTPILEALRSLRESKFLLCLGRGGVHHVVTVWDLAQPAASQLAFGLALVVEGEVARAIDDWLENDGGWDDLRSAASYEPRLAAELRSWEKRRQVADQIALGRSLTFGAKVRLLAHVTEPLDLLRARSKKRWRRANREKIHSELGEVCSFRNKIGHDSAAQLAPDRLAHLLEQTRSIAHDLAENSEAARVTSAGALVPPPRR